MNWPQLVQPLDRVKRGDPLLAENHNKLLDTVNTLAKAVREEVNENVLFRVAAFYVAKTDADGIPGMSGTTPGSAQVDLWGISSGTSDKFQALKQNNNSRRRKCFNMCPNSVAGNTTILVRREVGTGKFVFAKVCS